MINNGGTACIYSRKETPKPINHERSENGLKRRDQLRNNKGQLTSPIKNRGPKDWFETEYLIWRRVWILQQIRRQAGALKHRRRITASPEGKQLNPPNKVYITEKIKHKNRHNRSENLNDYLSQKKRNTRRSTVLYK